MERYIKSANTELPNKLMGEDKAANERIMIEICAMAAPNKLNTYYDSTDYLVCIAATSV